jgi:putative transferase (TIGR04331 family)
MSYFLATTALEEFWDVTGKVLFLGDWCKLYSRRERWEELEAEVLPYHWDDRRKLLADFSYLSTVYERCLRQLGVQLNKAHDTEHPPRYWRIVIGPWLQYFVQVLFDRYQCILAARASEKVSHTLIVADDLVRFVPRDFKEFQEWFVQDWYNLLLYSRVIEYLGGIPFCRQTFENAGVNIPLHADDGTTTLSATSDSWSVVQYLSRRLSRVNRRIAFLESYFRREDLVLLQISLGQLPMPLRTKPWNERVEVQSETRKRLHLNAGTDDFSVMLDSFIPPNLPQIYLEGYEKARQAALGQLPESPKTIVTANAYSSNEVFKLWAAERTESGAKLVILQHGGHYGIGRFSGTQSHELSIADHYITWGWTQNGCRNATPLPAQKLIGIKGRAKLNASQDLFLNLNIAPRYSYRLYSIPIASQWESYIRSIITFLKSLSAEIRDRVICRLYPLEYGWDMAARIKDEVRGIKICEGNARWTNFFPKAKMAIETTNLTTFLESMTANIPTILFLQPELWELSQEGELAFRSLADVRIFHPSAMSAAQMLEEVGRDPTFWWNSQEVQAARKEFVGQFACSSDRWISEWRNLLIRVS